MDLGFSSISMLLPVVAGCFAAVVGLIFLARSDKRHSVPVAQADDTPPTDTVVLFDGDVAVDFSNGAERLLAHDRGLESDWAQFVAGVESRFDNLPDNMADLPDGMCTFHPRNPHDLGHLLITRSGGLTRVTLVPDPGWTGDAVEQHEKLCWRAELDATRQCIELTPSPIWLEERNGTILWANAAYYRLAQKMGFDAKAPKGTSQRLFDKLDHDGDSYALRRDRITGPGGSPENWFDLCAVAAGHRTLVYAVNVDTLVSAEIAQRNFVQTLTKTFAHLSIGLAIFNRDRQLALFNPALVDLTRAPADFLSGRPTVMCFFDRLRDNHTMPEPKNYSSWRERVGTLVAAASDGRFQETWSLTNGQTLRVTGRPHPDGAVAFLFEDISQEVTLTRSFRSELAMGNAVLNALNESVAVFGSDGILTFSNAGFRTLWGIDPDSAFANTTTQDFLRHMADHIERNDAFDRLKTALSQGGSDLMEGLNHKDGRKLLCRVRPVGGGARVMLFQTVTDPALSPVP